MGYNWKHTTNEQWLTFIDEHGCHHAVRADDILHLWEEKRTHQKAFESENLKVTHVVLRNGDVIRTHESVESLVKLMCGDRSSKD